MPVELPLQIQDHFADASTRHALRQSCFLFLRLSSENCTVDNHDETFDDYRTTLRLVRLIQDIYQQAKDQEVLRTSSTDSAHWLPAMRHVRDMIWHFVGF